MYQSFIVILALVASSIAANASESCPRSLGVQSKDTIISKVDKSEGVHAYFFVKDLPILAYQIVTKSFGDIPAEIRNVLGAVDSTTYTEEYLGKHIGSVIALQIKDGQPDFYIIEKHIFESKYRRVQMEQLLAKNSKLVKQLRATSAGTILDSNDSNLVALVKTVPVEMVRASHLGYPVEEELTIESPWGEQKKPAGKDAFLTFDSGNNQYYMVNVDESGMPVGYVAARPEGTLPSEFVTELVTHANAPTHTFIKDLPILGYKVVSASFDAIPNAIKEVLGEVDQTKYTPEFLGENIGSVFALQMNGDKPDFYLIDKGVYTSKYAAVPLDEFATKNAKLAGKLKQTSVAELIENRDSNLVAMVKTAPVMMVKMSEVGLPIYEAIIIQSPWGEQTKPAGQDAYLTKDPSSGLYYMINSENNGRPIGYVKGQK